MVARQQFWGARETLTPNSQPEGQSRGQVPSSKIKGKQGAQKRLRLIWQQKTRKTFSTNVKDVGILFTRDGVSDGTIER